MKKIATDIYSFERLITQDKVYVDKTALLHRLVTGEDGDLFFISRPRRFGKSLMLSTLKAIFEGRRELFEGLAISQLDYDWKPYPVIHFDMSGILDQSIEKMEARLCRKVILAARKLGFSLENADSSADAFELLWEAIQEKEMKVVVLIDEYDVPMQGFLNDLESLQRVQRMLHDFYVRLKENSENIRFLMMTGVSKFAMLSIFSGLNNLNDISMDEAFSTLLGYTDSEVDTYFNEHIQSFAKKEKKSYEEMRSLLREWYNGYHFSPDMTSGVYNPISIGFALMKMRLGDYWIRTGGTSLILERLRKTNQIPADMDGIVASMASLDATDSITMSLPSLLYQSGYLTIKNVNEVGSLILGVPNREVRSSLTFQYLQREIDTAADAFQSNSAKAFLALTNGDYAHSIDLFRGAIADLPFSWLIRGEDALKVAFFSFFYPMPDVQISKEKEISSGKIDAVVETPAGVYIFEFKYNKSAQIAHDQVLDKGYAEPYRGRGKPVYAIGLNFTPEGEKRGVDEAVVSQVHG